MKIKISIQNRWTGKIIFEYEKENNTVEETLLKAISIGCNLSGSDFRGCYLHGCDFSGCDLSGCNLSGSDFRRCDFSGCDLSGCNLSGSDFRGCDFSGCDLSGCNLSGSDFRGCNLLPIKNDLFNVLIYAVKEIPNFKKALIDGCIDGSTYSGSCACLCGTLMKTGDVEIHDRIDKIKNSSRPIERFFLAIKPGNTPENNQLSKLALEWTEEFENLIGITALQNA